METPYVPVASSPLRLYDKLSFLVYLFSKAGFLVAAIVEGCGGTLISMITTMMAESSLPQDRGRIFALCIAGFDLGIAIAAPILGSIAEQIGYHNIFGYGAALTFLALIIFLTQCSKNVGNSLRFAFGRALDAYTFKNSIVKSYLF